MNARRLAVISIGIVVFLFWQQHQQMMGLKTEGTALRKQVEQVAAQRDEARKLAAQLRTIVEGSESDRGELIRLRGQAARLGRVEQENVRFKNERQNSANRLKSLKSAPPLSEQPLSAAEVNSTQLPPGVTNLGIIEFSDRTPMRLDLGEGTTCLVTTTLLDDGQLSMVFSFETDVDGVPTRTEQSATVVPGKQFAMTLHGALIALTPTLGTQ